MTSETEDEPTRQRTHPRASDTRLSLKYIAVAAAFGVTAIVSPVTLGVVWGTVIVAFCLLGSIVFAYAAGIRTERSWW